MSIGLYVLALLIIGITHWFYRWRNPKCKGKLPPGSMGLPLIGETLQFFITGKSLDVPPFIKKRLQRYGPVFRTSLAGRSVVVTADPDISHYIFSQEGKKVELWYLDSFGKILGQGDEASVNATGYIHKYLRNLVFSHFGNESLKTQLLSKMEDMARQNLSSWSNQASVEVKRATATMIFDLTSSHLFGYDSTQCEEKLSERFTNLLQVLMCFPLNIPGTTFHQCLKNQKKMVKIMKDMLEERLASPEKRRGDFLDHIIDDMKTETFLTKDFIVFVMFGLLLASFETISSTLSMAIKLLTENPLALKELTDEHEAIIKRRQNIDSPITWEEYKSMTFTYDVINETLRLTNVAPGILRKATKDVEINGYTIPEGWTIMVVPSALQLNPNTYENPLAFNPWRWKESQINPAASKNFIAFGGGMRACAGAEFSKVLMSVFLHVLVTKYRWTKIKGGDIVRTPVFGFKDGFYVEVSEKCI